jgi:branched-subunit amino acid aminotransferase/4-amino-4-deoxychorismate lyase
MPEALVYLNGRMLPASQAHVAIFDLGLVLGATVAEMTRTFRRRPFRLDDHLDRLFRSLHYVRFKLDLTRDELAAASHKLIEHNAALLDEGDEGDELGLVQFVTAGESAMYAASSGREARQTATVCAHTFPLAWNSWAERMREGARLVTPSIRNVPPQCFEASMKCRSRMHFYLADQEARLADPAALALLLDLDGNVTETPSANFLMVEGGTIVSPTLRNTLPGVSRQMVIELAAELGLGFIERDFQIDRALHADEALLTSTPYCLMPVATINGSPIGGGKPGPMFRKLIDAWSRKVGVDIERQILDGAATASGRK